MNTKRCRHGKLLDPFGRHLPQQSTDELMEEAKKYFPQLQKKEEPKQEQPRRQPKENEIKKLKQFIDNAFDY